MIKKILLIGMLVSILLIMGCITIGPAVEVTTEETPAKEVSTAEAVTNDIAADESSIIGTWVIEYTVEGSDIVETFLFSDDGSLTVIQAEGTASAKTYVEFTYTKTDITVIDRSQEWTMKYALDGITLTLEGNMLTFDSGSGIQVYTKQ